MLWIDTMELETPLSLLLTIWYGCKKMLYRHLVIKLQVERVLQGGIDAMEWPPVLQTASTILWVC